MRRSHSVPAESQSSSESCMPVLLTSRADALRWIGDKISISASEGQRSARRRSSPPMAGRTSEFLGIGGGRFECSSFLELMLSRGVAWLRRRHGVASRAASCRPQGGQRSFTPSLLSINGPSMDLERDLWLTRQAIGPPVHRGAGFRGRTCAALQMTRRIRALENGSAALRKPSPFGLDLQSFLDVLHRHVGFSSVALEH